MKELDFLLTALELKDEKRTGWELRNIEQPETVAGHSWGVSLLTLIYSEKNDIDQEKAVKMSIVHDLAEAEVGDIAKRAVDVEQKIPEKEKEVLEKETMNKFSEKLESREIIELWEEYENRETDEAKFVKDMDLIDLCLQALKYELQERYNKDEENENFQSYSDLDEFFATTQPRLRTDTGKEIFEEVKKRYEKAKK